MTRVLGAADICAVPAATSEEKAAAIATAQAEYRSASVQVTAMIQRQARFIYFLGVPGGAGDGRRRRPEPRPGVTRRTNVHGDVAFVP